MFPSGVGLKKKKNGAKREIIGLTFLRWTPVSLKVPVTYT